jgi:uncharacterized membrane protein
MNRRQHGFFAELGNFFMLSAGKKRAKEKEKEGKEKKKGKKGKRREKEKLYSKKLCEHIEQLKTK